MEKYKELFPSTEDYHRYIEQLEKKISTFATSYMSNAKWRKLFTAIIAHKNLIKQCEIYDFFGYCVNEIAWHKVGNDSALSIQKIIFRKILPLVNTLLITAKLNI